MPSKPLLQPDFGTLYGIFNDGRYTAPGDANKCKHSPGSIEAMVWILGIIAGEQEDRLKDHIASLEKVLAENLE